MTRRTRVLQEGSVQHQISLMQVGESKWVETTVEEYGAVERAWNMPRGRRTESTKDFVLKCSAWKAVSTKVDNQVVILVKVERVA